MFSMYILPLPRLPKSYNSSMAKCPLCPPVEHLTEWLYQDSICYICYCAPHQDTPMVVFMTLILLLLTKTGCAGSLPASELEELIL